VVRFVYAEHSKEKPGVYIGSVGETAPVLMLPGRIAEIALGHEELFFRRGSELMAQPFDSERLELSGEAQLISANAPMAAAGEGTLAYYALPEGLPLEHRITWFSRSGEAVSTTGQPGAYRDPRLSRDGRWLAVASAKNRDSFEIWTYDLERNLEAQLTGGSYIRPTWRNDGALLAQSSDSVRIFQPGHLRSETWTDTVSVPLDIASDGTVLVRIGPSQALARLGVLPPDGGKQPRPFGSAEGSVGAASFSPDGRWVAYQVFLTDEPNKTRVYVERYPDPGPRHVVTGMTAGQPRWRGDGRELYYLANVGNEYAIVSIPIAYTSNAASFGAPTVLFRVAGLVLGNHSFDVTRDGQRFVAIVQGPSRPSSLALRVRATLPASH
jgi:dipeptidyl aminopeptidase/acylaminoacyl peptidase